MGPARVIMSHHVNLRIEQRGLNHKRIKKLMHLRPYEEGKHDWTVPGYNLRLVYWDKFRTRTVVTAINTLRGDRT